MPSKNHSRILTMENEPKKEATASTETNDEQQQAAYTNPAAAGDKMREMLEGQKKHNVWAIVGYILPILFFIPLMQDETKNDEFTRFHANQQALLLIVLAGLYVAQHVLYMIFFLGWLAMPIIVLLQIGVLVLVVLGVINAVGGKMKELPLIGGFKVL